MKKKYKNKAVGPVKNKAIEKTDDSFMCVRSCNVPGVGTFQSGEKIFDKDLIEKISGSPCFKPTQEVQ